jgi:hypothetical protein
LDNGVTTSSYTIDRWDLDELLEVIGKSPTELDPRIDATLTEQVKHLVKWVTAAKPAELRRSVPIDACDHDVVVMAVLARLIHALDAVVPKHKDAPMAVCPRDATPLVSTFEVKFKEWHCMTCGDYLPFFGARGTQITRELDHRHQDIKAKFDAGERGPIPVETPQCEHEGAYSE